ncbi:MAG: hypothetical protein C4542_08185 [Dehalococcoidia bacterium]|nr:MAG: hypothetical protein C4542_08185 [Dehalococcoidia bacterium]
MARIPLQQVETGPLIAPALHMANQIREGRARAAITEETARNAPESQRLAIGQQKATLEGTQQINQMRPKQEERAAGQDDRSKEIHGLNMAKGLLEASKAAMADVTDPKEYMRRRDIMIKQNPTFEGLLDELTPEEQTPEGFIKAREKRANDLMKLDKDLQYKFDALETTKRGQDIQLKVAEIYANAREANKTDPEQLKAADKRLIYQRLYDEWADEYKEQVEVENPETGLLEKVWRTRPDAPKFDMKWKKQRFAEDLQLLGNDETSGAKPKLEY